MSALTQPWIPRGLLSEARLTADTTFNANVNGTFVDATGTLHRDAGTPFAGTLSVVVGLLAGRRYLVRSVTGLISSVAGDEGSTLISDGTTTYGLRPRMVSLSTVARVATTEAFLYPTSATYTLKVQVARLAGTGNVNLVSGSSIAIWDCGLAP